jgi:hypothetical protein
MRPLRIRRGLGKKKIGGSIERGDRPKSILSHFEDGLDVLEDVLHNLLEANGDVFTGVASNISASAPAMEG